MGSTIKLKPRPRRILKVDVEGVSPLLMNRFYDEKRAELEERYEQGGRTKTKDTRRMARDVPEEIEKKLHKFSDGAVGFPASGFLKGMVEVAVYFDGMNKKRVMGAVRVIGSEKNLVPIDYKDTTVNITWGRQSGINRAPHTIYRPEFREWSCTLEISYDESLISPEEIVNLLNVAGEHMGIGDWRPQNMGSYGIYRVKGSNGGEGTGDEDGDIQS